MDCKYCRKEFWNTVKPFLTIEGFVANVNTEVININVKIEDECVRDKKKWANLFILQYINTVGNISCIPTATQRNPANKNED